MIDTSFRLAWLALQCFSSVFAIDFHRHFSLFITRKWHWSFFPTLSPYFWSSMMGMHFEFSKESTVLDYLPLKKLINGCSNVELSRWKSWKVGSEHQFLLSLILLSSEPLKFLTWWAYTVNPRLSATIGPARIMADKWEWRLIKGA